MYLIILESHVASQVSDHLKNLYVPSETCKVYGPIPSRILQVQPLMKRIFLSWVIDLAIWNEHIFKTSNSSSM